MQPRPRLLTEYIYKADALQVQAGSSLLFALTQNGLETYTLHTLAAALLNMEAVDNITNVSSWYLHLVVDEGVPVWWTEEIGEM